MPTSSRIAMLLINAIPLTHVLCILSVAMIPWASLGIRILAAAGVLYLVPPVLARVVRGFCPLQEGLIYPHSRSFLVWLLLLNLQVLFGRLPFLDEALRIVPGLYSMWLRLWGAKIGCLTYWSAGTVILERPFLSVGDHVIFGAGVRVIAHVLAKDENGQTVLYFGTIKIGDRVLVGGYSVLTAGTEIAPDQETKAFLRSRPFSYWKDGKRSALR